MRTYSIILAAIELAAVQALMHKPGSTVHKKMIQKEKQNVADI